MAEPNIRFKRNDGTDYPAWENDTLDNLGTFMKGAGLSKADISDTGNPFILYGELYTTYNEVAYDIVRKTQAEVDEKYYSKIGDVLIPTSGESPEEISTATCVMQDGVILAGDLNIYRSDVVDGRVMSYIINHKAKDKIARIAQGKSVVHIQAKSVGKVDINYPPDVEEQQKIADFLSSIDDVIAESEKEVAALEEQKKGAMQKIFSQEVRFKDDNGNDYPEWEEKKLSDLVDHYGGTALEKFVTEGGTCKFISIGNYSPDGHYVDNGQRINPEGKAADKRLNKNDLVMVLNDKTAAGVIIGSTILIDDDNYVYNQRSERMVCKEGLLPKYMWHYMNSYVVKGKILKLIQGATQIYVNFGSVYGLDLTIPCFEEQQKIANFLSDMDTAIDLAKQELEAWKELKKGLLQQLFE